MGDWFRMVGKAPVETQPIWLRGNERRSGALALAVADASRIFDAFVPGFPGQCRRSAGGAVRAGAA